MLLGRGDGALERASRVIRYRSVEPVLTPELPQERYGTIANVVFPTGIDRRNDLGLPDRFNVYYGMADNRIGVARLDVPAHLPQKALADAYDPRAEFSFHDKSERALETGDREL